MFEEWRYSVTRDETHFLVEYFEGEKLGDDEHLWSSMASLVEPDSVIELSGEDGAHWKYSFKGNKFKETHGSVSYDDDELLDEKPKKRKRITIKF